MKSSGWILPAVLALFAAVCHARPVVIENVSTIENPAPALWTEFAVAVAVDGDDAIVAAQRWTHPTPDTGFIHQTAFLYRRAGTGWTLVRQLAETVTEGGRQNALSVAMKGGVAVVHTTPMSIYERQASGWVQSTADVPPGDRPGYDIEIDAGRILYGEGECGWNANVIEKSADGVWRRTASLAGSFHGCSPLFRGGAVDLAGDWAIVHQPDGMEVPAGEEQAWIYRRSVRSGWTRQGVASIPWDSRFWALGQVAANGQEFFASSGHEHGIHVFRDVPGQGFRSVARIRPLDSLMGGGETFQLKRHGDYLLQKTNMPDRGGDSNAINVFRRQADGRYTHAAVLVARHDRWFWFPFEGDSSNVAMSGRTVLATDHNEQVVYHFELPASLAAPAARQDTFATGNAPDWAREAGAFTVVRGDRSRVLRQADATGDSRVIYQPADWTNQAIELDVRPTRLADGTSAISLITRWQGPHNYYELVWGTRRLEFRRMASGTLRTLYQHLGEQFNPPHPGRDYRVRFESIGTLHRVYIDGIRYFSITSTGPTRGRVGIGTYRASADFDNVLVTPTPIYTTYANEFYTDSERRWNVAGGSWDYAFTEVGDLRFVQDSLDGDARATIGVPATDQSVRTTARLVRFAAPSGTQRRWFGLVARYVDADNHYLLALRNSNALVLTRRVNGQDTTLGSFTVDVVPGRDYTLRLDAVGDQLRAYLDQRLLFEAVDEALPEGNAGLATFKAHAEFSELVSYQP